MKWLSPTLMLLLFLNVYAAFAQKWSTPIAFEAINSAFDELNPVMTPDGSRVYFTRKAHPENIGGKMNPGDIWYVEQTTKGWSEPRHAGQLINNKNYNAVIGFSTDGKVIYLHGKYTTGFERGVSRSVFEDNGEWGKPAALDIPYFKDQSEIPTGSLYFNGEIMLLSLERYDSKGNEDLYVCFLQGGNEWSELFNLGPQINTVNQEFSPFLSADGKRLFFSSNGHGGKGSLDIFYSDRLSEDWMNWSKPKPLNDINSKGADWFFSPNQQGDRALLVSKSASDSYGNIFISTLELSEDQLLTEDLPAQQGLLPKKTSDEMQGSNEAKEKTTETHGSEILIRVNDAKNGNRLFEDINMISLNEAVVEIAPMASNRVFKVIVTGTAEVKLNVGQKGYIKKEINLTAAMAGTEGGIAVALLPLDEGMTVQLKDVLFERGTADFLAESERELYKLLELLKENEHLEIEIAGHTDNQGMARMNIKLSQERAESIKDWLVAKGISEKRLSAKGYGGVRPIASNASEETRQLNRRVEFTVIKK